MRGGQDLPLLPCRPAGGAVQHGLLRGHATGERTAALQTPRSPSAHGLYVYTLLCIHVPPRAVGVAMVDESLSVQQLPEGSVENAGSLFTERAVYILLAVKSEPTYL